MELEQTKAAFAARGLNVAAVTHDSVAITDYFARRKGISFPMLSNREGKVAFAFGIDNQNHGPDDELYGMPFPGTYIVDADGVVKAKFFEEDHGERYTASTMLVKQFHDPAGQAVSTYETRHLKLRAAASEGTLRAGNRVTLSLRVALKPKMHVYAPGVEGGYIPIDWTLRKAPAWVALDADYPKPETLHLEAIGETVPVYEGEFDIERDFVLGQDKQIRPLLHGGKLIVNGSFRYQACDDKMCFPPRTVPVQWTFQIAHHDEHRVPKKLRQ